MGTFSHIIFAALRRKCAERKKRKKEKRRNRRRINSLKIRMCKLVSIPCDCSEDSEACCFSATLHGCALDNFVRR